MGTGLFQLEQLSSWQYWLVALAGLLLMFAGYRIKKVAFFVLWFLIGWTLMSYLMPVIANFSPEVATNEMFSWLLPFAGGILLAMLGFSIEKLCVAGACFALVIIVTIQYFGTEAQVVLAGAIVGVIAAGAAVALMKPAIILATSVGGAYFLTLSLFYLFPELNYATLYWPLLIGGSALGSVTQFFTTKRV